NHPGITGNRSEVLLRPSEATGVLAPRWSGPPGRSRFWDGDGQAARLAHSSVEDAPDRAPTGRAYGAIANRRRTRMSRSLTAARAWTAAVALLWLGATAPAAGQQPAAHDHARAASAGIPLYDDLGTHHRRITTRSREAQAYFDQGLRLQYAFNHPEAIQSYQEALRRDPDCAMCWWGIALAAGPNINGPMSPEAGRQ